MQEAHRRKFITWASCIALFLLVVLLALTTTTLFSSTTLNQGSAPNKTLNSLSRTSTPPDIITSVCEATIYPAICQSTLRSAARRTRPPKSSKDVFDLSVEFAMARCHSVRSMAYNLTQSHRHIQLDQPSAMDDCLELLDISLDQLDACLAASDPDDIGTWLSAAMTNQATCMESLKESGHVKLAGPMRSQVHSLNQYVSNSLALLQKVKGDKKEKEKKKEAKKAKKPGNPPQGPRYPAWMTVVDRKLLEASPEDVRADAVVAKDGSGTHRTIGEALASVSPKSESPSSNGRSVIYIKAGVYEEYINIPTKQKNVMLMGDGKGSSVIVGSKNVGDGSTTYRSATVGAMGAGFIAKGLTIINNSGPQKHQAVALRVGADKSVIYQCSVQGYQDTLYSHSNRQFYRDTDVYGTVDFIFGNAAAVYQNCRIQPRKPGTGQKNSVTAQGRLDPNQNTGFSIQSCRVESSPDVGGAPVYLGRPWHKYSRAVFMETYLDRSVNPAGWEEWSGDFALSTLYYAEYKNTGPGSSTSGRVKWPGVHSSLDDSAASKFTVREFIFGDAWLPGTGVEFNAGL